MDNSVESKDEVPGPPGEAGGPMAPSVVTEAPPSYAEVPQQPHIYQNQMLYPRMPHNGGMVSHPHAPGVAGNPQGQAQALGPQMLAPVMRVNNGIRPGQMYYYPMAMYNHQHHMMGPQIMVNNPQAMNNQAAIMSKFMPQYSAYLGRMQQEKPEIKVEPGQEHQQPQQQQQQQQPQAQHGGQLPAAATTPAPVAGQPVGAPMQQMHGQPHPMGMRYSGPPPPPHPHMHPAQQQQYAYQMMMYNQQSRLMVGNAIEGIPALRMANSQFQNVTQMLDALAKQPPKKRRIKKEGRDDDTDFKNVMHEYFDGNSGANANASNSKGDSDDEYMVGRGVSREVENVPTGIRRSGRNRTRNTLYAEYAESDGDAWSEEQSVKTATTTSTSHYPNAPMYQNVTAVQHPIGGGGTFARKRRGPVPGAPRQPRQARSNVNPYAKHNFVTYDESEESEPEYQEPGLSAALAATDGGLGHSTRGTRTRRRINYAEMEQDAWDDQDTQDDWSGHGSGIAGVDDDEYAQYQQKQESVGGIDRIINNRVNEDGETEYLIKWQGFAHIHNTWETYENLADYNGIKRLDNYIKKMKQLENRRTYMSVDEIEQENIAMELQRQIDEDALQAERLVSHYLEESTGKTIYLVKWRSCPYDQCTEEEEEVLRKHNFGHLIEAYHDRENRICGEKARSIPWNTHSISLTKFEPYTSTPSFLAQGQRKLRDYQLTGLNWMVNRMKRGLSVLLADEMGLGKTVQTISLVGHFMYKEYLIGPYLVIVPQSTIDNWMREFETWLPQANAVCYYGNATAREIIRQRELQRIFVPGKGERYRCDVCVTTPSIINSAIDLDFLRRISWQLMVVDEAHQLKNRNSKRFVEMMQFMADYKLLLSGTPLHNNLEELWTLLHFINPQIYTYYEEFRRRYSEIENPVAIGETKQKQLLALQQELHEVVLRRVKKDVEKSLPNKVERILRVELSPMQIEWYKNILTRNYDQLAKNSGGSRSSLQNICMELKKVCNHPFLCYEPEDRQLWLQGLVYGSGKICLLEKLLQRLKERGHRVLIFSQMVRMLNIISEYLTLKGFKHQRLDGTMGKEVRKKAMDHFNDPQSDDFCFLLSTKAGGLGINLTSADTVIIYDSDWNPQNDLQAEARAHRIGQTKTVQIYRLVTKDSIEQTILERAKTKMVLDALVVQGLNKKSEGVVLQEDSKTGFSREELAKILKFGAQKLWAKNSGAAESAGGSGDQNTLDIDLDKVLEEAEVTTGVGDDGLATDLLNSYTNITEFRYEPPEDQADGANNESNKEFWEATIPLEERLKLKKKKEEELLVLGPRRTRQKESGAIGVDDFGATSAASAGAAGGDLAGDDDDDDDDDDDAEDADFQPRRNSRTSASSSRLWQSGDDANADGHAGAAGGSGSGRRRGPRRSRRAILTAKDKVKIYRALAKFGVPEYRLSDICNDTKLFKVDARVVLNECQNLIDVCKTKAEAAAAAQQQQALDSTANGASNNNNNNMSSDEKKKYIIELGDVKINPVDFLERLSLLEALEEWGRSQAGPSWAKSDKLLNLPQDIVDAMGDSKERWTLQDCINLLKLVHIYGYGYWTVMCADEKYCTGALEGMKHDRAKSRILKILKLIRAHVRGVVPTKGGGSMSTRGKRNGDVGGLKTRSSSGGVAVGGGSATGSGTRSRGASGSSDDSASSAGGALEGGKGLLAAAPLVKKTTGNKRGQETLESFKVLSSLGAGDNADDVTSGGVDFKGSGGALKIEQSGVGLDLGAALKSVTALGPDNIHGHYEETLKENSGTSPDAHGDSDSDASDASQEDGVSEDDASEDSEKIASAHVPALLASGQPLKRRHYAAAVKWALGGAKDTLKRLKVAKASHDINLPNKVQEALPRLALLVANAQASCKDPMVAQRLVQACWTFVSKFTYDSAASLEQRAKLLQL